MIAQWWVAARAATGRRLAYEIVLAVLTAAATVFTTIGITIPPSLAGMPFLPVLLAVAGGLAALVLVPLRLVYPVGAYLATAVAGMLTGNTSTATLLVLSVSLGYRASGLARVALALVAGVAEWLAGLWFWQDMTDGLSVVIDLAVYVIYAVVPVVIGRLVGQRHALITAMNDRNVQLHRAQTAVAVKARARERTRIARDLHDPLGHQLTLISPYAGAPPAVPPEAKDETLALLRATSAEAMAELRQILRVLRQEDNADELGAAQPPSSVDDLAEAARSSGAQVTVTHGGTPRPLPPLVEHAAYRVIQEGLTNALRHASGAPVGVTVRYELDTPVVEVVNGSGTSPDGPGTRQGLIGLAERVRLTGGILYHGAVPGNGSGNGSGSAFRLAAILPYITREPASADSMPAQIGDFSQELRTSSRRSRIVLLVLGRGGLTIVSLCTAAVVPGRRTRGGQPRDVRLDSRRPARVRRPRPAPAAFGDRRRRPRQGSSAHGRDLRGLPGGPVYPAGGRQGPGDYLPVLLPRQHARHEGHVPGPEGLTTPGGPPMTEQPVRVLIADDDQLVRAGIRLILTQVAEVEIVAEAANGREAVELTVRHRPQVVLLDIRMPVMDGLAALREIRLTAPDAAVLVLTTFGGSAYVVEALAGGAAGFLLKDSAADDLARAIRAAATGEAFLSTAVTRQLLNDLPATRTSQDEATTERLANLSDREREVLLLLAQGMSNATISEQLWITEGTVKTHVSHLLTKLNCENRVQAALLAHRAGLLR